LELQFAIAAVARATLCKSKANRIHSTGCYGNIEFEIVVGATHIIKSCTRVSICGSRRCTTPKDSTHSILDIGGTIRLVESGGVIHFTLDSFKGSEYICLGNGMITILWNVTVFAPSTVNVAWMIGPGRLTGSIPLGVGSCAVIFTMTCFW